MKDFLCFSNAVQKCHSFELQGLRSSTQSIMLENLLYNFGFSYHNISGSTYTKYGIFKCLTMTLCRAQILVFRGVM